MTGCEVTLTIASETRAAIERAGQSTDEESLQALYDCGVFDILEDLDRKFTKGLKRACGEDVSDDDGSASPHSHDSDCNNDDGESDDEEFALDGISSFQQFERDKG